MKAALSARVNKSDRNDACGIAHMMRVGLYRPVHVKTLASQKHRTVYHSVKLDDPSFPAPIYANLVVVDEGYALVWSR